VVLTTATELEFWVKTPNKEADIEALSASQDLQESYWKRTKGAVRTAMEQSLLLMSKYGFEPEMGHKEVGGIKAQLSEAGSFTHIMEQLEIDWKYDTSLQSIDNEKYIRVIIKEIFRLNGLEVTFDAKPIEGVAGNGKHTHVGIALKLKDGRRVNIFTAKDRNHDFLSELGYGALMGILKHYEVINPFISSTIDSLNRLKPGFEAPVCIVSSLGHNVETPSRNRTVLVGLVRDLENPFATRFEVRSPNPNTNTYLAVAAIYQSMLDGMNAVAASGKTTKELEAEISKKAGTESFYLEKDRAYRSEADVFEHFTAEERDAMFAKPPATVYDNVVNLTTQAEKRKVLLQGDVMSDKIIMSFQLAITNRWVSEVTNRLVPNYMETVRNCRQLLDAQANELDMMAWAKVNNLRHYLMKDTSTSESLFTRIRNAAVKGDYQKLSTLQLEMDQKIGELKHYYGEYKKNLLDFCER
jgi:glutamine synthetase